MDSLNIVEISTLEDVYPLLIIVAKIVYIKPYRRGRTGSIFINFLNTSFTIYFKSIKETMRCYTFLKNNILDTRFNENKFNENRL